jgi:hypothetical protein
MAIGNSDQHERQEALDGGAASSAVLDSRNNRAPHNLPTSTLAHGHRDTRQVGRERDVDAYPNPEAAGIVESYRLGDDTWSIDGEDDAGWCRARDLDGSVRGSAGTERSASWTFDGHSRFLQPRNIACVILQWQIGRVGWILGSHRFGIGLCGHASRPEQTG